MLIQKLSCLSSEIYIVHKRNCILLACYLGLSQQTIESKPFTDGFKEDAPRPCCICGLRVTAKNYGRHTNKHKHDKQYGCRYCSHVSSRKDNCATHEEACQKRLSASLLTRSSTRSTTSADRLANATPPDIDGSTTTISDFDLGIAWSDTLQPLAELEEDTAWINEAAAHVLATLPDVPFATIQPHAMQSFVHAEPAAASTHPSFAMDLAATSTAEPFALASDAYRLSMPTSSPSMSLGASVMPTQPFFMPPQAPFIPLQPPPEPTPQDYETAYWPPNQYLAMHTPSNLVYNNSGAFAAQQASAFHVELNPSVAGQKRRAPTALDGDHADNERLKAMRMDWDLGVG